MYEVFDKLCKEHGVTAYRVAQETGIRTSSLSSWKKGIYELKDDKMKKIADYFGVSVEYLRTGEDPEEYYSDPETARIAQKIHENKELRGLFSAAEDASPETLSTIHEMLLIMKKKEKNED